MQRIEFDSQLEIREEGEAPVLVGNAAVYYDETRAAETSYRMGAGPHSLEERMMPGLFDGTLADPKKEVFALLQHDIKEPLARRSAGTLQLEPNPHGIGVSIQLANTTAARDVVENVRAGNLTGMSVGFKKITGGTEWVGNTRLIHKAELKEVSLVTVGAYEGARVALRCTETDEEFQAWLKRQQRALDIRLAD